MVSAGVQVNDMVGIRRLTVGAAGVVGAEATTRTPLDWCIIQEFAAVARAASNGAWCQP